MGTYANFYNSDNNDRVYDADSFSEWLRPFFKNGVFNGELQVVADSGMNVKVRTGNAYIDGKMKKFENETTLTLEKASANSTRIDSVVVRRNDTERDFSILVVKGSTSAPDPVRQEGIYDLVLAQITVGASVTEIKQSNIKDTRMNADLCGWVVTNVNEIDFSQITSQWYDYIANFEAEQLQAFQTWFDTIKGQLGSDVAGSLQTQINNINSDISSLQSTVSTNTSDINSTNAKLNELNQTVGDIQTDVSGLQTDVSELQTKSFEGTSGTIETQGGYLHDMMIFGKSVQDGTPTPDSPIEIQSVVNPKVTVCGKNLATINKIVSNNFLIESYLTENTVYTLSFMAETGGNGLNIKLNNNSGISIATKGISQGLNTVTFTMPQNGNIYINSWVDLSQNIHNMQLELGSVATEYEPYKGQSSATLPYTLNAIPVTEGGNVTIDGQQYISDYVDIENKKLIKYLAKVDVSGTFIKTSGNVTYRTENEYTDRKLYDNSITNLKCSHFKISSYGDIEYGRWVAVSSYTFGIKTDKTLDEINALTDLYIMYPLATPTEIDLTDEEVAQFKALKTYEPTTNIIASSDVLNPLVKCDYSLNKETNNIYDRLQENASDVSNITNRLNGLTFVTLTQTEYDALSTKDNNTIYFITEG